MSHWALSKDLGRDVPLPGNEPLSDGLETLPESGTSRPRRFSTEAPPFADALSLFARASLRLPAATLTAPRRNRRSENANAEHGRLS